MKRLAHSVGHGIGSTDELLERLFDNEAERDDVRRELLDYEAPEEQGKPRLLYQQVTEIIQSHDPLCFEHELLKRIEDSGASGFILIDDVRSLAAFEYFSEHGFKSVRINAPEDVRRRRMLSRDGHLPDEASFEHSSETDLDDVRHDFDIYNTSDDPADLYRAIDDVVAQIGLR